MATKQAAAKQPRKWTDRHLMSGVAFLVGFVAAIIIGMLGFLNETWLIVFITFGFLVGLLNVTHAETTPFLVSGVALVVVSVFGQNVMSVMPRVNDVLYALLAIFVPATLIVAIKNVFIIARQ